MSDMFSELFHFMVEELQKRHPTLKRIEIVARVASFFMEQIDQLVTQYFFEDIHCPDCHSKRIVPCLKCRKGYWKCSDCGFTGPLRVFFSGRPSAQHEAQS